MEALIDMMATLTKPRRPQAEIVDDYATILAEIAQLSKQKDALAAEIKAYGLSELKGTLHRVVVSNTPGRQSFDVKLATKEGAISQEVLDKYTKWGKAYDVINVYGLK